MDLFATPIIPIVLAWLFLGWLGLRVAISWWTWEMDWTREDQIMRWMILLGPINLVAASVLWLARWYSRHPLQRKDPKEILYPRKDMT